MTADTTNFSPDGLDLNVAQPPGRWFGVYSALVCDIKDPDAQGRVKIRLPWSPDSVGNRYEAWARLATLMAGNDKGSWFIPDIDDEVLVAFEAGDPRFPFVIGSLWNGRDSPPEHMDGAGRNDKKVLKSRNGITITFDDEDGKESLTLETPGGQKLKLSDGPGVIDIEDNNGNEIKLEPSGITVTSSARVIVRGSMIDVSAGMLRVDAGMCKFLGVVQAETIIAKSVVSSSYTPGAGNIW